MFNPAIASLSTDAIRDRWFAIDPGGGSTRPDASWPADSAPVDRACSWGNLARRRRSYLGGAVTLLSRIGLRLFYFATYASLGVYLPFFPRWLEARGIVGLEMGIIAATFPAMGFLSPPLFGYLADALRLRGWLMRFASAASLAGFLLLAAAAKRPAPPAFAEVALAVAIFAFFRSPMILVADVIAMDADQGEGPSYGKIRLWGSLGFLVAVVASGRFVDPTALFPLPAVISAFLLLAAASAWTLPLRSERTRAVRPAHVRELVVRRDFALFLVTVFCAQVAHSAYDLTFSLHMRDLGSDETTVGIVWAIGVAAEVALLSRFGSVRGRSMGARALSFALLGSTLRWALIAAVRSTAVLMPLQLLHALSFGLTWISSLEFLRRRAPPHIVGSAQGLFMGTLAAASASGMLLWGPLYKAGGGPATFATAAGFAGLATIIATRLARQPAC